MPINIRPATIDDIPALEPLISRSVRALSPGYYNAEQIESALIHIFGIDSQLINDGTYYIAEAEQAAVGCGGWSKRKTLYGGDQAKGAMPDPLLNPAMEAARIRAFYVHPDWARRGIARQILAVCETAAKNANFQAVELVATMPGEPLYQACGYQAIERFEIDLPDGIKLALTKMQKNLV
jgi:GNAT superfamily N-acetyltransferase